MSMKTVGLVLLLVGIVVTLISLLADILGIGNPNRFGTQQIAGTVIGVAILLVGAYLYMRRRET